MKLDVEDHKLHQFNFKLLPRLILNCSSRKTGMKKRDGRFFQK